MADATQGEGERVEPVREDARVTQRPAHRRGFAMGLMLASGFASLGYQIVWTQQCALWLGHEAAAVLAVVAAFFGGLALGALTLGARIERSARPARWYAACEVLIGAWGLALALLLVPVSGWLLSIIGERPTPVWQWTVAFVGTFVLLLPATAAMGATLPAMERVVARTQRNGASFAMLYAGNTFGAVLGVLGAALWLVPAFGLVRTAAACALLNALCATIAFALFDDVVEAPAPRAAATSRAPLAMLAATGLLGIGYEVLVVRVLSQVAQNTVYTFAILLAVYLVGSAFGAAAWQRWARRARDPGVSSDRLLCLLAAACIAGTVGLWNASSIQLAASRAFGSGMASALAGEAVIALVAFLPATIVMGALFSQLCTRASAMGIGFGRSLGVNTLGACAAPFIFGVWMVPLLGAKAVLLLIASAYLLLSARRLARSPVALSLAGVVAGLAAWAPPLVFIDVPEGGRVVSYREGPMAAVSVVEDAAGVSRLRIDNHQQEGSSATLLADARQALLPMLLHPAPRRALFLGLGTGMTASSAAEDPMLEVDAVELLPEVIEASSWFTRRLRDGLPNPRLHLIAADARRFVRSTGPSYDLIVADNFHPARGGSGALYTLEHFEAVRERLAPEGVFCQWLPLHQLDLPTLRSIVAAFVAANPHSYAMVATNSLQTPVIGLVARKDGRRFDLPALRDRLATARMTRPASDFGIGDDFALLGGFIAGPRSLAHFAQGAALNTDDRPIVAYRAPRITYAPDSTPADRLLTLLASSRIEPGELLADGTDVAWRSRLAAYWSARDRFIEAGRGVQPSPDVRRMLAQVREPLMSVLRISPDFRPAYEPLQRMAGALSRTDPAAAELLLDELARIRSVSTARADDSSAVRDIQAMK